MTSNTYIPLFTTNFHHASIKLVSLTHWIPKILVDFSILGLLIPCLLKFMFSCSSKGIYIYIIILLLRCISVNLMAQPKPKEGNFPAPTEAELEQILQKIKVQSKHQRLKIGGDGSRLFYQ